MTQRLSGNYLSLLIALQEGPMDTLEELAEKVGYSRTTVSKYLQKLQGRTSENGRQYFRVIPNLDEAALGLQTVDVFMETSELPIMRTIEHLCDKHPYTKYRSRCYGHYSGVFAQFRVPISGSEKIRMLLEQQQQELGLDSFVVLPTMNTQPVFTVSRLEHWNVDSFTWEFDWHNWAARSLVETPQPRKNPTKVRLDLLNKKDLYVLTKLGMGARRKQIDIIRDLKEEGVEFRSQEFSRRYSLLKEYFIEGYHVFVNRETFDLYSNVILTAQCSNEFGRELQARVQSYPIPFRSTLKVKDDFIFWYLRLPQSHLSSLLNYLQQNVDKLTVSLVDYIQSEVYALWAETFDEDKHQWKIDDEFMMVA
ncbi:MAG: helix-turn-helix domain-containing protein [Promethearchaeia archaeon]